MALALSTEGRKRRRFRFRPEWEWNTFLAVPRFRSAPDPPACPSSIVILFFDFALHFAGSPSLTPSSVPLLLPTFLFSLPRSSPLPSFCILPRHPYRKCIYVLCKAGNRRWPREPDARRVINTDALVLSNSLPFSFHPVSTLLTLIFLISCRKVFSLVPKFFIKLLSSIAGRLRGRAQVSSVPISPLVFYILTLYLSTRLLLF